jgi:hypothetical protein
MEKGVYRNCAAFCQPDARTFWQLDLRDGAVLPFLTGQPAVGFRQQPPDSCVIPLEFPVAFGPIIRERFTDLGRRHS